jgi:hypothetical protein
MAMMRKGEWRAQKPENEIPGFHISGLYSAFDGANWAECVASS